MKDLRSSSDSDCGFTLLEMLIAMTLLGLLSVVLFSSLRFGVRSWDRSETMSTQANLMRQVQTLIASELSQAYPEVDTADPTRRLVVFDGTRHSLTYLARDHFHPGALDRVVVAVAPGTETLRRSAVLELSTGIAPEEKTLLKGLASFEVSYFGTSDGDQSLRWQDDWRYRKSLPKLIRIRARFAEKGSAPWPDLTVAPLISADVSCNFDPLIKGCREP